MRKRREGKEAVVAMVKEEKEDELTMDLFIIIIYM